jgi:hypothetical protein
MSSKGKREHSKMVEMAGKLKADVFGDDGEAYRPGTWRAVYGGELRE